MLADGVEVDRVLRRATPVVAASRSGADAGGQQNALGPGLQRDLVEAVAGVFPQADYT
jgi:hypothetical protein